MLVGWVLVLAGFTFLTLYTHPFLRAFGTRTGPVGHSHGESAGFLLQQLGIAGIVLQTAALLVVLGLLVHRFPTDLPAGWVTLVLGSVVATTVVLGGSPVFVPAALWTGYFVTVEGIWGIGWAVHAWGSAILLGVFAGVMVSYLLDPPAMPASHG